MILTPSQLSATTRLFSSAVFREMAKKGRSALFSRLFNQSQVGWLRPDATVADGFEAAFSVLKTEGLRDEYIYRAAVTQKVLLGRVRGQPQIDIILQQAAVKGIPALYFLYNHTRLTFPNLRWNCPTKAPEIEQLGCTVAHAAALRPLVTRGGVGIVTLGAVAVPLRCLVCCRGHVDPKQPPSLPARANGIAQYLAGYAAKGSDLETPSLRANPPWYVNELIATPADQRHRVMEKIRSDIGPIGSLIVIKDRP